MKKVIFGIFIFFAALLLYIVYPIWINPKSPKESEVYKFQGLNIEISYSRPSKRGRLIFGNEDQKPLLPYGKYWRLGANAPTTITFSEDVKFAGKYLKQGKYCMFVTPYEKYWKLTLNSQINSSSYERPDPSFDVFSKEIKLNYNSKLVEQLKIFLSNNHSNIDLSIEWDNVSVDIPIQLN